MRHQPLQLFVLIDALGWEYVRQTGFLADLLPHRTKLRTVLGFSSGAIPSILTGMTPSGHGRWNLLYYDPAGSPFRWIKPFRVLPDAMLNNRYARKIVKEVARRALGIRHFECCIEPSLLPWFNWAETKNIYAAGNIPGGKSIFDHLAASDVPHRIYSYHSGSDAELLLRAMDDVRNSGARFFFVYLCELDAFLHMHCQDQNAVAKRLEWYAETLRALLEQARMTDPDASLTVFSDHGMTPVEAHIDLAAQVARLGLKTPNDYLAVYDATMARFWFFSQRARDEVRSLLDDVFCGRLLSEGEREALGIRFADNRYGDEIFLLDPGWLITSSGFHRTGWLPSGMHGYHPDDRYSDAAFLSNCPIDPNLSSIPDIYHCMRAVAQ